MGASEKAVAAVMETLGCEVHDYHERPFCVTEHHLDEPWFRERWGDRGCEFAARLADAAVKAQWGLPDSAIAMVWRPE